MQVRELAPIALFAYRRAEHLRRTLAALAANPEASQSSLHVFCDGAKGAGDAAAVEEVRAIAHGVRGFAGVQVHARERNAGLASSIIEGVTQVLESHARVIVVEDDLVVSPHFLAYMNEALRVYEHDEPVASVHGYSYPTARALPETFFLRGADCWGWATWPRAWRHFEPDGAKLRDELRERGLAHAFDLDGAYPYVRMLDDQVAGRNDSWAIRWHASAYLRGMLTLHPGRSLVCNIGHDGSGTHSGQHDVFATMMATAPVRVERRPLQEDKAARAQVAAFMRSTQPQRRPRWRMGWRAALRRAFGS